MLQEIQLYPSDPHNWLAMSLSLLSLALGVPVSLHATHDKSTLHASDDRPDLRTALARLNKELDHKAKKAIDAVLLRRHVQR